MLCRGGLGYSGLEQVSWGGYETGCTSWTTFSVVDLGDRCEGKGNEGRWEGRLQL